MRNWTANKKYILIMVMALLVTAVVVIGFSFYTMRSAYLSTFSLYNDTILHQTTDRMEAFHDRVLGVFQAARGNVGLREYLSSTSMTQRKRAILLNGFLSSWTPMIQAGSDLGKIIFLGSNGMILTLGDYSSKQMNAAELAAHPLNAADAGGVQYAFSDDGFFTDGQPLPAVIMIKRLPRQNAGQSYGTMFVVQPEAQFAQLYANAYSENSSIAILDAEGMVISSNRKEWIGTVSGNLQQAAAQNAGLRNMTLEGKKYLTVSTYLPSLNLYMVNLVDQRAILAHLTSRLPILYAICALIVAVSAALMYSISFRMNQQLRRLMRHMSKGQQGKLTKIDPVGGEPEVRLLQESFNRMTEEIDQSILRLQEEQRRQQESEIKTLQAQINPHFLYNTLASIKFLSWQNQTKGISEIVDALTLLLRSTIGTTEREETVEAELEVLKSYTCIAHWRYGESIKVVTEAEEGCLDASMPRMIVQPFLENAFFHAYQIKKEGTVTIRFALRKGRLLITVADDGDGMRKEDAQNLLINETQGPHFTGMGVRNVRERLHLLYGEEAHIQVASVLGQGTVISFSFPAKARMQPGDLESEIHGAPDPSGNPAKG